jgi:hypothetical protein
MNCKNCKHWRRGGCLVYENGRLGLNPTYTGEIVGSDGDGRSIVCLIAQHAKIGLCLHPSIGSDCVDSWLNRSIPDDRIDGVFAGCDENRGYLAVGENFGCIHFLPNV